MELNRRQNLLNARILIEYVERHSFGIINDNNFMEHIIRVITPYR